jgi:hypothetical protein
MAMYRVAVRVPDGDDVPMLLRGAQTLYGSVGEGSPREVLAGLERACAEAAEVFQSRPGATWEAGCRFGPRRAPARQRIYTCKDPDGVAAMLASIRQHEKVA